MLNENLEQQAQAYFEDLFVVNADPNWPECTLSDIGSIVAGGTPSKSKPEYYADQGIAWITPKDLSIDKSKFMARMISLSWDFQRVVPKKCLLELYFLVQELQ